MDKVLTYAELITLAKKHYNEGGDGIVECWSERDFDEYVKEFGPVTVGIAFSIMEVHDVDIKAEITALFGSESGTATQGKRYSVYAADGKDTLIMETEDFAEAVMRAYESDGRILDEAGNDVPIVNDDGDPLYPDYLPDDGESAPAEDGKQLFKVVMVSMGGTCRDMFTGLTSERAHEICEEYGWEVAPDGPGSYVWDLEIEEDEEALVHG